MNPLEISKSEASAPTAGEIVLYQPDETIRLEVWIDGETVWLTQAQIGVLFGRDRTVIGRHIRNIFFEGELLSEEVCANFAHTTQHGAIKGKTQTASVLSYNLDVIISVGYRVKSQRGIQFRRWANRVLKEYLLKGFVVNQRIERLENFAIETKQQVTEIQVKLNLLAQYVEDILADSNEISEETRMELELVNRTLAEIQSKHKLLDNPRNPIGFRT